MLVTVVTVPCIQGCWICFIVVVVVFFLFFFGGGIFLKSKLLPEIFFFLDGDQLMHTKPLPLFNLKFKPAVMHISVGLQSQTH